jgi:hypothetical protein
VRVAVVGGDERVLQQKWPDELDVRSYTYDDVKQLLAAARSGSFDRIVVLTRWISHGAFERLQHQQPVALTCWPHGIPRLAEELASLVGITTSAPTDLPAALPTGANYRAYTWRTPLLTTMQSASTRRWSLQELLAALDVEDGSVAEDVERVLIELTSQKAVLVDSATGSFRLASITVTGMDVPGAVELTVAPSVAPSDAPSGVTVVAPSDAPSGVTVVAPSVAPSDAPSGVTVVAPSDAPSGVTVAVPATPVTSISAPSAPSAPAVKPSYLVQHGTTFEGFTELDEAVARFSTVLGAKLWRRLKLQIKVGPDA